ncbi:ABC transporter substrate-binding protein [Candidatus Magnetominusculus dajiuhuensis]|uniref:ABC transporter substrate-binding protein n=1 Tax=Candidatus Magnetominusculus dajiuhuensis TaxID=3137712 RepID=UPI003B42F7AD
MRLAKMAVKAAIWLALVSALALGNAAGAAPTKIEQEGQPIKAALLYNSSGPMASIDEPAYKGAMLAAKLINAAGGITVGQKLELIPTETGSNIAKAGSAGMDEKNKDVVAAIGYGDSAFVISAASPFVNKGIPYITPGATLPTLPGMLGERFFMTAYGDDDQGRAIADYAYNNLNVKRIVVWTDTSMAFTLAVSDSFKRRFAELGGTVLYEDLFKSGMPVPPDLSKMVERLSTNEPKPEAVFVAAIEEEAALSVKLLRNGGIDIPVVSADGFDSPLVEKAEMAKPITNVYFSTHAYRGETRKEVTDFIKAYKKEYGKEPDNAYAALGYDAVNILADAIRRIGSSGVPDKDTISKALSETKDFKAVTGVITMRPKSPPAKSIAIAEIKDGKYTVVHTWRP